MDATEEVELDDCSLTLLLVSRGWRHEDSGFERCGNERMGMTEVGLRKRRKRRIFNVDFKLQTWIWVSGSR